MSCPYFSIKVMLSREKKAKIKYIYRLNQLKYLNYTDENLKELMINKINVNAIILMYYIKIPKKNLIWINFEIILKT